MKANIENQESRWPKKILFLVVLLASGIGLASYSILESPAEERNIEAYYASNMQQLAAAITELGEAVQHHEKPALVRQAFRKARLQYKRVELFLEYYYELDAAGFNGPPIPFIEEEDPTAYQEVQGFQVIESLLYPEFIRNNSDSLSAVIAKLQSLASGLAGNASLFRSDGYGMDAAMEELYRILTLGITGFDAQLSGNAMAESAAALETVIYIIQQERSGVPSSVKEPLLAKLNEAKRYLLQNRDFNKFDRIYFITNYLNPICDLAGSGQTAGIRAANTLRFSIIQRKGNIFREDALDATRFLGNDRPTPARAELGKQLFYDNRLSSNQTRSCASCHKPEMGFTDGLSKAMEISGHSSLPRNTPTLWNAYLQMNLFDDSRRHSLDGLILEVMGNHKEMNSNADSAAAQIIRLPDYHRLFQQAYPEQAGKWNGATVANAIANYLRSLTSYHSRFDKFMRGDRSQMNREEQEGFNLFAGKARCATCHFIPLFNGSKPPSFYYQESEVLGIPANTDKKHPIADTDPGRFVVTQLPFHRFAFKTPTLRNITLTAPYMHNGVYQTLEEVLDFYNDGGGRGLNIAPENQTLPFDKLNLTKAEIRKIIAFMGALTDTSALHN